MDFIACQAPLSMGFSRQESWRGWPFPSPGNLPNPWIEPTSPTLQVDSLPLSHQGNPSLITYYWQEPDSTLICKRHVFFPWTMWLERLEFQGQFYYLERCGNPHLAHSETWGCVYLCSCSIDLERWQNWLVGHWFSNGPSQSNPHLDFHCLYKVELAPNPAHLVQSFLKSFPTSLVGQWLRIRLPLHRTWVPPLVWEDSTRLRAAKPVCPRAWALQPEKPPLAATGEKPEHSNEDPVQTKK